MKKLTTIVNFILDESGSMDDIKSSTISGFNEYLKGLKKNKKTKTLFTLTKFDSEGLRTPYVLTDISKVELLTSSTFQPGSMTPLYDAVVETVESVTDRIKDNEAALVVIMTDGLENASKKHTEKCLHDLIHKLQAKGNWTFIFLGANQDSWATAKGWGISAKNVMDWQASPQGTQMAYSNLRSASVNYMSAMADNSQKGVALNSSSFFEKGGDDSDNSSSPSS